MPTSLTDRLGREPTEGELYIAHFLGADRREPADRRWPTPVRTPRRPRCFRGAAQANPTIFYDGAATPAALARSIACWSAATTWRAVAATRPATATAGGARAACRARQPPRSPRRRRGADRRRSDRSGGPHSPAAHAAPANIAAGLSRPVRDAKRAARRRWCSRRRPRSRAGRALERAVTSAAGAAAPAPTAACRQHRRPVPGSQRARNRTAAAVLAAAS